MSLARLHKAGALAAAAWLLGPAALHAQDAKAITVALPVELNYADGCSISSRHIGIVLRQNVIETLTVLDPETSTPLPRLATGWERVDDNAWRFQLREGVRFHDGTAFDAAAVARALERHQNPDIACLDRTKIRNIKITTEVVDDHTIDIVTDPPQVLLPTLLSFMGMTHPDTSDTELVRNPVGTGPYVFGAWPLGGDIVIERFDGYWGEQPEIEKATYVVRADSTVRAAMVELGEADIGIEIAHQDATNPELDHSFFNTETTRIRLVPDGPPLDDIRVRKALNLAFDREALVGTVLSDGVVPATQFILPNINGHNPDLQVWTYDPDQAKALLAAAKEDGVPVDRELRLIGRIGFYSNQEEVLQAMAQMWNAVGMDIRMEMMEQGQWLALVNRPYPADRGPMLIQEQHDNANGDAVFTMPFKYRTGGQQSDTSDPVLDDILDRAALASGDERRDLFREANRIVAEELVPAVPMYHMVAHMRISPRLDFVPDSTANGQLELARIHLAD
jgi:peptide/nickel transport system substrate-binding protein